MHGHHCPNRWQGSNQRSRQNSVVNIFIVVRLYNTSRDVVFPQRMQQATYHSKKQLPNLQT